MNEYTIDKLFVGQTEKFEVEVTEEMQENFRKMSGDNNPMHVDTSFANNAGYKGCLVYGMCTASLYSTLVGEYLPGKYCLFHKCDVEWPSPVYIGDILTVKGTVREIDRNFNKISILAEIRNQDNVKVSRAKLVVGVGNVV